MNKKDVIITLGLILLVLGGVLSWNKFRSKNLGKDDLGSQIPKEILYYNQKYHYSLEFPQSWLIGYDGASKETAETVWFVPHGADLKRTSGDLLKGVQMMIVVENLDALKKEDPSLSKIRTVKDWLEWERTYQVDFESESRGQPKDSDLEVNGIKMVKSAFLEPLYPDEVPKKIEVTFFNSSGAYLFKILYEGFEPAFSKNQALFESLLSSFNFVVK